MNFISKKSELLQGLQTVTSAVSSRNTLPILANILFETENNKLILSGTDLELSIKCEIEANIVNEGSITIPAKKLLEIVRELPETDITIKLNDKNVIYLTCGKSLFKINGLPKKDFPILPEIKTEKEIILSQKNFNDMIKKTIFSVSSDETRYVLNGVLLSGEKDIIRMVSTDGHRLSFIEKKINNIYEEKLNNIIPAKALNELVKILKDEGEISIQINNNQIIFLIDKVVLISRLIEGQFPNFGQVIPKENDKSFTCYTEDIMAATKRVALMASDKSNSVKYSISNNKLLISSNTPEVGEAQEEMDINYSGENIIIAYNAKYVLNVLKNLGSKECLLELSSNLNPGVFKPKGIDEDTNYLCVVMPMRV